MAPEMRPDHIEVLAKLGGESTAGMDPRPKFPQDRRGNSNAWDASINPVWGSSITLEEERAGGMRF